MLPRIQDVAREAGVSLATVSRVLNNSKHVEAELRRRVLNAVEVLGYVPNQQARWLSSRRSNVVGLVLTAVEDCNSAGFLHACSATLRANGFESLVGLTEGDRTQQREIIQAFVASHVSGLVVSTGMLDAQSSSLVTKQGIPLLLTHRAVRGSSPCIRYDLDGAVRALIDRIPMERFSSPCVLAGEVSGRHADAISGLFTKAIQAAGHEFVEMVHTNGSTESAYHRSRECLADRRPDLMLCTSDELAVGALRAAYELGLQVPGTIAITGFGASMYAAACAPPLTTVALDRDELGRRAGSAVLELVRGEPVREPLIAGYSVVPGGSCPLREDAWQP